MEIPVQTRLYFQSSLDHLLAELKRIELKVQLKALDMRQNDGQVEPDDFKGLYISEKQIDAILNSLQTRGGLPPGGNPRTGVLTDSLKRYEESLGAAKEESRRCGRKLRLDELKGLFGLSDFDLDVLLAALLPELDLDYQRVYAYLQDDITRKGPTINFVLQLLCAPREDMLKARQVFSPEAPLLKYHLISLADDHIPGAATLLSKTIAVDQRITSYLLETGTVDPRLLPFAHPLNPTVKLCDVILPGDIAQLLDRFVKQYRGENLVCRLRGAYGIGKQTVAKAICSELGKPMLYVGLREMISLNLASELMARLVFREGILQSAAIYLDGFDSLSGEERGTKSTCEIVKNELGSYPGLVFLGDSTNWQPRGALHLDSFIDVELPLPSYIERKQLWERQWHGNTTLADDVDIGDIANKFRFNGGQISDAAATARNLVKWRDPENRLVTRQDLYSACHQQSREILSSMAHKIQPKYGWDDIILPGDQTEQLHEVCSYVKHYQTVYSQWGFERKLSLGKGLNVLFAGPSGTGKTMAAEIIAGELGLELYKIDLSSIVSKYIGETEKNLDQIFREGQTSNAILFFDEADALFGKRSEVRDSHDRYANIEIAYLLQKMDEYAGVVILATNLRKNMDEAFSRRMHFVVEFPVPEEAERYRIWEHIFPPEAPLDDKADIRFMARQFRITGGNIKNIAITAAFLAAENGGHISTENLIAATKREYQKIGKLCTEGEFAGYFEVVKGQ